MRFRCAKHATDLDIEATAEALKNFIGSTKNLHLHKVSLSKRKSKVAGAIRHWRDVVGKNRSAVEAGSKASKGYLASSLEEEAKGMQKTGLLGYVCRVVNLAFAGCGTVPAWHDTSFVMAW